MSQNDLDSSHSSAAAHELGEWLIGHSQKDVRQEAGGVARDSFVGDEFASYEGLTRGSENGMNGKVRGVTRCLQ